MRAEPLPVTNAEQSAARDSAAIAAGTESFALMLRAGTAIAEALLRRAADRVHRGVCVCAGSGNNGGDGYIVALQLHRLGVPVTVWAAGAPRTPDAIRAAALAREELPAGAFVDAPAEFVNAPAEWASAPAAGANAPAAPGVVVDALLGTGARGALRAPIDSAARWIASTREAGAFVLAADVPTGLDASTGSTAEGCVSAHTTVSLGTCKAGLLGARSHVGHLVVADIGLGTATWCNDGAPSLTEPAALRSLVPPISWNAHKGTRGHVLLVGGTLGMAGAVQLAARGALRSGAGLVRASVAWESMLALQAAVPELVCLASTRDDALMESAREWAHAVVIGPGLGRNARALERLASALRGAAAGGAALVLDADALTLLPSVWSAEAVRDAFATCAASRSVVLTPHWGEFRTLAHAAGVSVADAADDQQQRLEAVRAVARHYGCTVLLKGTPTLSAERTGETWVTPRGAPTLASGGSGDVLSGVLGALLAHQVTAGAAAGSSTPAARLAAVAAWVHGVAGEPLAQGDGVRGVIVSDVVEALPGAWRAWESPPAWPPGVLTELPWYTG